VMIRGDQVLVSHEMGSEQGTIVAILTEVVAGEGRAYTVRFDDGTNSTWHESRISPIV
jgi:hypothetical protein